MTNTIKILLSVIIFCSLSICVYAQNDRVSIKLAPLALIDDISMPAIQSGIEFKLSKHFSWYNEVGIKYRKCINERSDTPFVASDGYKIKSELRYYFSDTKAGLFKEPVGGFYVGGNLFFINDNHNTKITYYPNKDSSNPKQDAFGVHKKVLGLNLIGGFQHSVYKNFLIDFYGGIGMRIRMVTNEKKEFNKDHDSLVQPIDFAVLSIRDYVDAAGGNSVVPSITAGVRLCYRF